MHTGVADGRREQSRPTVSDHVVSNAPCHVNHKNACAFSEGNKRNMIFNLLSRVCILIMEKGTNSLSVAHDQKIS